MQISVASGKGGTGKTMVAVNLTLTRAVQNQTPGAKVQLLDCDVEGPNCHVFLRPEITERQTVEVKAPRIDQASCTHCGVCSDSCEFNAMVVTRKSVLLLPELCHGCGVCAWLCPAKAISEIDREIGVVESGTVSLRSVAPSEPSNPSDLLFTHGFLNPGEPLAPTVIGRVRSTAQDDCTIFLDVPAGNSCSMVESVMDTDFCILVTEPTPFGLHDLVLAVETLKKLNVPSGVVINRCDLGDRRVEEYCKSQNIPILLKIPLDRRIAELYARGEPVVAHSERYQDMFEELLVKVEKLCKGEHNYAGGFTD